MSKLPGGRYAEVVEAIRRVFGLSKEAWAAAALMLEDLIREMEELACQLHREFSEDFHDFCLA